MDEGHGTQRGHEYLCHCRSLAVFVRCGHEISPITPPHRIRCRYCQCFAQDAMCKDICKCIACLNTEATIGVRARLPACHACPHHPQPHAPGPAPPSSHATTPRHQDRDEARKAILSRNPSAFANKLVGNDGKAEHKLGCKCRKSACLKKCVVFVGGGGGRRERERR